MENAWWKFISKMPPLLPNMLAFVLIKAAKQSYWWMEAAAHREISLIFNPIRIFNDLVEFAMLSKPKHLKIGTFLVHFSIGLFWITTLCSKSKQLGSLLKKTPKTKSSSNTSALSSFGALLFVMPSGSYMKLIENCFNEVK